MRGVAYRCIKQGVYIEQDVCPGRRRTTVRGRDGVGMRMGCVWGGGGTCMSPVASKIMTVKEMVIRATPPVIAAAPISA